MAPRGPAGRLLLASLRWARGAGPDLAPLARDVRRWPALLADAGGWGIAMAARYGVPERSPRLLLYYVARPFLAVRDRLRR